jgi:hypothetical protein
METTNTTIWYIEGRKRKSSDEEYNFTKVLIISKIEEIQNNIYFIEEDKLKTELQNLNKLKYYLNNFETIKEHLCGKIQDMIRTMD